MLSGNTNIPVEFFERHISSCEQRGVQDKVDWFRLSGNTNIPFTFFKKYKNKIRWNSLSFNTSIPSYFNKIKLNKIIDKLLNDV